MMHLPSVEYENNSCSVRCYNFLVKDINITIRNNSAEHLSKAPKQRDALELELPRGEV